MVDASQSPVEKFTISLPPDLVEVVDEEAERIRQRSGAPKAQRSAAIRTFILEAIRARTEALARPAPKRNRK